MIRSAAVVMLFGVIVAGCGRATGDAGSIVRASPAAAASRPPATVVAQAPRAAASAVPKHAATAPPLRSRVVTEQQWTPFANVGAVTLSHPSRRVERVAFHESNHEGAQQLEAVASAVSPSTLESRGRLTRSRTSADVVSDPAVGIRAPVSGTVKRAGTYVLYCRYSDDYVVIEPDAHPGWEVKVLHIDGVRVSRGDRVTARVTMLAPRPTKLPFESQVDETSAQPAWPHVHIEVVDPRIPNRPSPGSGC